MGRGAERIIVQNAIFHGKRHDNKILEVNILLSRIFVVMAQAPNFTGRLKGGFRRYSRVVLANVPSFLFFVPREHANVPSFSGFRSGGTCECTLVLVFVLGEHRQNHPFGKPPFWEPPKNLL